MTAQDKYHKRHSQHETAIHKEFYLMMEARQLKYKSKLKFKGEKAKVRKIIVSTEFQLIIFQLNTELELNKYRP